MTKKNLIPQINSLVKKLGLSGQQLAMGLQMFGPTEFHQILLDMRAGKKTWSDVKSAKQSDLVSELQDLLVKLNEAELTEVEVEQLQNSWADFIDAIQQKHNQKSSSRFWHSATKARGKKSKTQNVTDHFFGNQPIKQTKSQLEHFGGQS